MGKNSGPPKCRTCGKEEWQHLCGPVAVPTVQAMIAATAPKPDRKEYLKLKARERRARQKQDQPQE